MSCASRPLVPLSAPLSAVILPADAIEPVLSSTSDTQSFCWPHITVDDAVTVTDEELVAAARMMALRAHVLVEPSGAASLAAALHEDLRGRTVVLIATGANVGEVGPLVG